MNNNPKEWVEEWCLLYPQDIKWNGNYIRAKPNEVINKLVKFCKTFPHYTKNIIFAATNAYLKQQKERNWEYTKRAVYFIGKQGEPSLLEQYCEDEYKLLYMDEETKKAIIAADNAISNFYNDFI